jgi:ABC-2 type transport system permease protein
MRHLIAAEFLKLRTTRTSLALIGSVVGLVVLLSLLTSLLGDPPSEEFTVTDRLGFTGLAQAFALVLGILAVTTEFRHGTITPTLIVTPDKTRLVLAKLVSHVAAGLLLGLLAVGLGLAIVLLSLSARGFDSGLAGGEAAKIVVGQTIAAGLWAALGVGLGALVRNQVGAIVGALLWTFLGESLLTLLPAGIGDAVQKYGAGGASNALGNLESQSTGDLLSQVGGGLLLAAYALVFVVAGILALRGRDITS